ncbi:MAG: hypothetical protein AABX52_04000 [Nanoarchaeota archaeon]
MVLFEHRDGLVVFGVAVLALSALFLVAQNHGVTGWFIDISQKDRMVDYVESMAILENQHVDDIPVVFRSLFGNARINGTIILNSGEVVYVGAIVEDGRVRFVVDGVLADPTMNVVITEQTIHRIADSADPASEAVVALDKKEIVYTPLGITSAAKLGIASAGARLIGMFKKVF